MIATDFAEDVKQKEPVSYSLGKSIVEGGYGQVFKHAKRSEWCIKKIKINNGEQKSRAKIEHLMTERAYDQSIDMKFDTEWPNQQYCLMILPFWKGLNLHDFFRTKMYQDHVFNNEKNTVTVALLIQEKLHYLHKIRFLVHAGLVTLSC